MKKNTFLTGMFVLMAVFTLTLTGCDNPTTVENTEGDNTTIDNGDGTTTDNDGNTTIINDGDTIPKTITPVIGYGYNITSHYAYSPDIKAAILDMDKLLEAKRVKEDPNLRYGEFETIAGKDINEYMKNITTKISYSANANLLKVVSFSSEVGTNFNVERITKGEYAFTTSTSRIVTGAYNINNRNGLDAFFTADFTNDMEAMTPEQLIENYGTHVMLGAVLGARADYHLSVQKKEQDNITNLGTYAKARAEATYKGVTVGVGSTRDVDEKYKQYFYTETTETNTYVLGGKTQYGQLIQNKQDYDKWIESIEGNEIWIDYYPYSLVPISDLVTDKSLSDALAQAIENYCKSKEKVISITPPEVGPISFRQDVGSEGDFSIKGGGQRDWLITSLFKIDGLRSAGYTKFVLTLNFDLKNELLINVGSRLYVSFQKGLAPNTTKQYAEKYWTPALSRWEAKEFIQEIDLTDFENQLTIHWGTSPNASYTVGTRSIVIEAKK